MQEYIDFTNCKVISSIGYNGGNGTKKCIEYNGKIYLLKIPATTDKYTNAAISEYIGCHIFNSIGIKAQKTLLGTYNIDGIQYQAVACEDFVLNEKSRVLDLKDFASYKNQVISSSANGYGTELSDILDSIYKLEMMDSVKICEYFWDMFIIDALLGNFDRHNGNWGFLVDRNNQNVEFSPIYDCGSCLYPALPEEEMKNYLRENEEEINKLIYVFPNSAIKVENTKINYYDFINSLENDMCNEALKRIVPKIKMEEIMNIIDNTPYISEIRKEFYKTMIDRRYKEILLPAYEKIIL